MSNAMPYVLVYQPQGAPIDHCMVPAEMTWKRNGYHWQTYHIGDALWVVAFKPMPRDRNRDLWFLCEPKESSMNEITPAMAQGAVDLKRSWIALLEAIAFLSDAMGLDSSDWAEADDCTLQEEFDPWTVVQEAVKRASTWEIDRKRLGEAVDLLRKQDREIFGVDPITGEVVDPWEADACHAWHLKARAFVIAALPSSEGSET